VKARKSPFYEGCGLLGMRFEGDPGEVCKMMRRIFSRSIFSCENDWSVMLTKKDFPPDSFPGTGKYRHPCPDQSRPSYF
jgi:hypothetical protein